MALCLPLAVLIGYFLAEPVEQGGVAVVALVLAALAAPLLLKYHHPLLVVGWNASVAFLFLPGHPDLWMGLAFIGLCVGIFNRAINPDKRFLGAPAITKALAFFAAVVCVTAALTGGIGLRSFGSANYGGRYYLEVVAAIAGYFALTSERIPAQRAGLYVGLFFLAGLTALVSNLVYAAGPPFYFLYSIFPPGAAADQAMAEYSLWPRMARLGGLAPASAGLFCWLLARYGVRGTFDYAKPWRLACFFLAVLACLLSGFRSGLILLVLTFFCVFTLEGLWRTRAVPLLLLLGLALTAVVLPQTDKLPQVVQRTLSFLPIKVETSVAEDARHSTEWRLDMWKMLEPQIPKYLLKGKGYTFDANDLLRAQSATSGGFGSESEATAIAMEYHNGPLSVLIPFGIFGLLGFLGFIIASVRALYCNYRFGDPALLRVNTLLLAAFAAKAVFFFVIFGALHSELFWFTGIVGLGISLNGGISQPATEPEAEVVEELEAVS